MSDDATVNLMFAAAEGVDVKNLVKSFDSLTNFMHSYGLKPWDFDDIAQAIAIAQTFARADAEAAEEERKATARK